MSIDTIKTFDEMCLYILDGHLEGSFFILIKDTYENPKADIIISGKRVNTFSIRSEKRQKYLISPLLVNTVLDIQAREGKNTKYFQVGKKEGQLFIDKISMQKIQCSLKILLELIKEFIKFAGYLINILK